VLDDAENGIESLVSGNHNKIEIIKDVVGLQVFWPEQKVYTLQTLEPGKAYLLKATQNFSLSYEGF